jgi:Spy/CpxP family protein refolding chaperone
VKFMMPVFALAALTAGALNAQNPPPRQRRNPPPAGQDSGMMREGQPMPGMMGPGPDGQGDPERMQMMRAQVEERMSRMIQSELQLSEEQMGRVRQAMRANQDRRIGLMRREQDLRRAIGNQMQPGQAANNDSLSRMVDAVTHLRVERAQSDEQMMRDLAFLTPVQRARLGMMLQRFDQRVNEIRQRGMQRPMMQRRGMRQD